MRTLTKSFPSLPMMERRPLCPPAPPPAPDAPPENVFPAPPDEGAGPFAPAGAAPGFDPPRARLEVQVVVDYDEVFRPVVRDGGARVVHEGRRIEERCIGK